MKPFRVFRFKFLLVPIASRNYLIGDRFGYEVWREVFIFGIRVGCFQVNDPSAR